MKRQLKQIFKSNVGYITGTPENPNETEHKLNSFETNRNSSNAYDRLVPPRNCDLANCSKPALPCTRYCTRHIMHNTEQVLFSYCTAKFADNTQCSIPVFDITHELPLCPEHARKRVMDERK